MCSFFLYMKKVCLRYRIAPVNEGDSVYTKKITFRIPHERVMWYLEGQSFCIDTNRNFSKQKRN